jgi:tetratricopeptide (TPR) repeat protein
MWKKYLLLVLIILTLPRTLLADEQKLQAPLFNHLGSLHFPVSTSNPLAQRFFNQGLAFYYGFEWGESIRSFKEATRLDPNCGMCYWGLALALGAKTNAPIIGNEYAEAQVAIKKAFALKAKETPAEQAYINALLLRYKHLPATMISSGMFSCHISNTALDKSYRKELINYANAMQKLTETYPKDNNAKSLYAYALFDLAVWKFWSVDGKIQQFTPVLVKTLQSILADEPLHIGANHYYIHVIEQSPQPADALDSAKRLKTLAPGLEHLVHMPTHIYLHTGQFHEGSAANLQAIAAFKQYNQTCIAQGFKPEDNYNYLHNYDYLRTTAMIEGRKQLAISAAREMVGEPFTSWLVHEPFLQWFLPIPSYVEIRFAMWDDILQKPQPKAAYQYATGMWHYARGMAFAHTGQIKQADAELLALNTIIQKGPTKSNLEKRGLDLLRVASETLAATLADIRHDEKTTFAHLKKAAQIQAHMEYHEPPDWYFPAKEALADAYLKWHHPQQAKEIYEQVLKQYPKNGWALFGLAKSLQQLNKSQEASRVDGEFKKAWRYADIPEPVSLF